MIPVVSGGLFLGGENHLKEVQREEDWFASTSTQDSQKLEGKPNQDYF